LTALPDECAARLVVAGLSEDARASKASLFATAWVALDRRQDLDAWWVPGRIEFLGKHTDYAGGPSLLCAVERGFAVLASAREDARISVCDAGTGDRVETIPSADMVVDQGHWSNYPLTVCRRVARNFPGARRGVDIAFASDLPSAAGLSSSSALLVATFFALAEVNDLSSRGEYRESIEDIEDLAAYLGAIENGSAFDALAGDRGVGTRGGSEDHTAILCAKPGALVQYSFAPIRFDRVVPLPNDLVFVIAVSGVVAAKTGGALALYNRAAARAAEALGVWREATGSSAGTLASALGEPNAIEQFRVLLRNRRELLDRVEQLQAEIEIVRASGKAIACGELDRLAALVEQSQINAERRLGNQTPETIELARSARKLGAVAASAFGAGFGGSVYALVRATEAKEFRRCWAEHYASMFPDRRLLASFLISAAGPAALKLRTC
jgi:galactokinase